MHGPDGSSGAAWPQVVGSARLPVPAAAGLPNGSAEAPETGG